METKRKEIRVELNLQREIAHIFKVSERTVQMAMRFETNSALAKMLRAYALNHGGKQYNITTIEEEEKNPYIEKYKQLAI